MVKTTACMPDVMRLPEPWSDRRNDVPGKLLLPGILAEVP